MEKKNYLTAKEKKKADELMGLISKSYWRTWVGYPIKNGRDMTKDLKRARQLVNELGVK